MLSHNEFSANSPLVLESMEGYGGLIGLWYDIDERRQAVAAFSTAYMGFRGSEVQILSPRL